MLSVSKFFFASLLVCAVALGGLVGPSLAQPQAAPNAEARRAATVAATTWLTLVDADRFGASYTTASTALRDRATQQQWTAALDGVRVYGITGPSERRLTGAYILPEHPELSGGPFASLMYDSAFAPGAFMEVVVLRKEQGNWKVAGYQLLPGAEVRAAGTIPIQVIQFPDAAGGRSGNDAVHPGRDTTDTDD